MAQPSSSTTTLGCPFPFVMNWLTPGSMSHYNHASEKRSGDGANAPEAQGSSAPPSAAALVRGDERSAHGPSLNRFTFASCERDVLVQPVFQGLAEKNQPKTGGIEDTSCL